MGEYADMAISDGIDEWRGERRPLRMWGNPRDFAPQYSGKRAKRCKRCGQAPLYWEQEGGRWLLHTYGAEGYVIHTCVSGSSQTTGDA